MRYWRELVWLLPGIAAVIISIVLTNSSVPGIALNRKAVSDMDAALQSFQTAAPAVQAKAAGGKKHHSAAAAAMRSGGASTGPSGAAAVTHNKKLENAEYEDGTYEGSGRGFGGVTRVRVTVKNGKISRVDVISNQDTPSYFSRALVLTDRIVKKQSTDVDAVSGATYSSRGIIEAVENALLKASKAGSPGKKSGGKKTKKDPAPVPHEPEDPSKQDDPVSPEDPSKQDDPVSPDEPSEPSAGLADGVFEGNARGFGGKIFVKVTVKDGKIAAVDVEDENETPEFFEKAKAAILPDILQKQTSQVDSVSGATFSSRGIKNAVAEALKKSAQQAKEMKKQQEEGTAEEEPAQKEEQAPAEPQTDPAAGTAAEGNAEEETEEASNEE